MSLKRLNFPLHCCDPTQEAAIMKVIAFIILCISLLTATNLTSQKPAISSTPKVEAEVMKLLDDYMSAWNRKDMIEWERTFHFPHYRLASGKMTVLERPGLQKPALWATMANDGWHHSKWDHRRIIHTSDNKVHVDAKFTRYRADGTKLGSYESLYIMTKENGQWGVKMRSSFAQ
jgi:hypothetical protein